METKNIMPSSLSVCLPVCVLCFCLSVSVFVSLFLSVSLCLSVCLCLCFCLSVCLSVSVSLSVSLSLSVSVSLSVSLSLSVSTSVCLSLCFCLCLSLSLHLAIERQFANNSKLYVTFIDFKKAYDSVNRNILWSVLLRSGIQSIKAMYAGVQACVKNNAVADLSCFCFCFFDCLQGLKQGCIASPILFSLLANELAN